jgi:hypothetical protein
VFDFHKMTEWPAPTDARVLAAFADPETYDWTSEPDIYEQAVIDALEYGVGYCVTFDQHRLLLAALSQPEPVRIVRCAPQGYSVIK